ncbi:helix-hairpin-helix domain-containing protein [Cellulosimicrobium arenosum]|uniref:helix-hairpin-helix domain-containing protein n=1 Tax=Cellulosimicrobium arenosum TaxID=2708133 RepID=UPI0030CA4715
MSTPRHHPGARRPRPSSDPVARRRLRALTAGGPVTRGGAPVLAWHPETAPHDPVPPDDPGPQHDPSGWVPGRPGEESAEGAGEGTGSATEAAATSAGVPVEGTAAQVRRRAAERVAQAYAATHGHPTTHAGFAPPQEEVTRRWAVAPRVAVAALVVVLGLGAVCAAVALTGDGAEVRTVAPVGEPAPSAQTSVAASARSGEESADDDESAAGAVVPDGSDGSAGSPVPDAPDAAGVVVHVVGQVASPGLVAVPEGARVADAIDAAGGAGPEADLAALNLARPVSDGEQIVVPRPGETVVAAPATGGGSDGAPPGADPVVDLNTADAAALEALPGVGPVLAGRIVQWRTDNGPFTAVEELGEVSGIGPAVLADVRDRVRV